MPVMVITRMVSHVAATGVASTGIISSRSITYGRSGNSAPMSKYEVGIRNREALRSGRYTAGINVACGASDGGAGFFGNQRKHIAAMKQHGPIAKMAMRD